jgi:hypothetical protein
MHQICVYEVIYIYMYMITYHWSLILRLKKLPVGGYIYIDIYKHVCMYPYK